MTLAMPVAEQVRSAVRQPNYQLRRARLRLLSPSGSGRPFSRQELAEAVNAAVHANTGRTVALDGSYVGRLERGEHRWPGAMYRQAFRTVLGATSDAELGFFITRRSQDSSLSIPPQPRMPEEHDSGAVIQFLVAPGTAVVVVPSGHPALIAVLRLAGADGQPADGTLTTKARRERLGQ